MVRDGDIVKYTQTPVGRALYEKQTPVGRVLYEKLRHQLGESFMKNTQTPVGRALYEKHSDTSWQSTV